MAKQRVALSEGAVVAELRIREWQPSTGVGEARVLDLRGLDLRRVPDSLLQIKFTRLRILLLSKNRLVELPDWIWEFESLVVLDLSHNQLRSLPDRIGDLSQLRHLLLQTNDLRRLPLPLRKVRLRTLALYGNPHLNLPESVLDRPPSTILRYYFESRAAEVRPLRELKLLLVGRGKAGKTTLVKCLAGEKPDAQESETHSISIRDLTLDCPSGKVQTRAWDFGGQEILHSTHQFFLSERSLYLLVLEPRTGLAPRDAEYWLRLIETQGAGSPVIVVLNQSHGRPWRVDEVRLRRKFPGIVQFVSTDALHGNGIDELLQAMTATVETMKDVWLPFPNRWRDIKNDVASMSGNFFTYRQYATLCRKHGEKQSDAQADLAGILHALGLALYFGDDPRLHDTRVLNPGWVTGGVYAVIRSPSVKEADGQLSLRDMPRVLREAEKQNVIAAVDYPKKTHGFILELMRAFQLCYASEQERGKPTRYLVPELLPEYEPAMPEAWEHAQVRLRYRYDVLPPGLLPRFIVRTHALGDGAPHWRHGVVLRHADAQALIRDESDKELQVFALGGDDDTRRLLVAMVRRELEPCASDDDKFLGKLQRLAPRMKTVAEVSPKSVVWEQIRKDLLPVIERARVKKKKA